MRACLLFLKKNGEIKKLSVQLKGTLFCLSALTLGPSSGIDTNKACREPYLHSFSLL